MSSMSTSVSNPVVLQTPENSIIDQVSNYASQLAGQMYSWAQQTYAQTSAISSEAIGNFLAVSTAMQGLSSTLTNEYNNLFAPENQQLVNEANSFDSTARQQVDMGQAGATQAQAGAAAIANNEAQLESYGIDPSSGRYAALNEAAAVQNAANVAGAENTQRNADLQTQMQLQSEAVQVGAQLPSAIANVNNTATQALTGAENSNLGNANTGATLMGIPNNYLQTAMGVKLPPVGQTSASQSSSQPKEPGNNGSNGNGGNGANAGQGSGSSNQGSYNPMAPNTAAQGNSFGSSTTANRMPNGSNAQIQGGLDTPNDYSDPTGQNYDPLNGLDPNSFNGQDGSTGQLGIDTNVSNSAVPDTAYNGFDSGSAFGATANLSDFAGAPNTFGDTGNAFGTDTYDPSSNQANLPDGWQDPSNGGVQTDWGSGANAYTQGAPDQAPESPDTGQPDQESDDEQDSSDDSDFATGGAIPGAGRMVPRSMSPSGGRRVDDVRAQGPTGKINLNANEFVIPQDVALWKGQEFFQNLIDQSRKRRMTASTQRAATQMPPRAPARPMARPPMQGMR